MGDCANQSEPADLAAPSGMGTGDSASDQPFFERPDWLSFGVTTVVILIVYLCTLAPEVTLEYSGILSAGAAHAGVPHPPGFPVWTIYSWCFIHLVPISNIAWRVAAGSAVAAALACGLVALMVSRGGMLLLEKSPAFSRWRSVERSLLRAACGYVAGMALGLSSGFWREAVIADIWGLSVLLFATMLCLLMRWIVRPGRRRFLFGAVFVFGLLLTSNQELIVVIPSLLLMVILADQGLGRDLFLGSAFLAIINWVGIKFGFVPWFDYYAIGNVPLLVVFLVAAVASAVALKRTRRVASEWKSAALCAVFLLLGLGFYLYVPIASMTNPPVNWAYPRTVEGFIHAITRGQYERPHPTDELGRFISQLWTLAKETGKGFGWFYLPFATLPFCFLGQTERIARNWLFGLMAVLVGTGPLMIAVLSPSANLSSVQTVGPFFCPMFVPLAMCAGLGLMIAACAAANRFERARPSNALPC